MLLGLLANDSYRPHAVPNRSQWVRMMFLIRLAGMGKLTRRAIPARLLFWITLVVVAFPACLRASCGSPANAIEAENCLSGTPQTTWDISTGDAGDPSIQGFADQISVKPGDTINFKINTNAAA